jgi:hypothetical protein
MSRRIEQMCGVLVMSLALALVAGMGAWWWIDRATVYERPRWDQASFEAIAEARDPRSAAETWVVAVNPACAQCMAGMAALADTLGVAPGAPRLFALIVDTASRPPEMSMTRSLSHPRLDGVYWDREGVWRARWGHRMYGEILRFDAAGDWIDVPRGG